MSDKEKQHKHGKHEPFPMLIKPIRPTTLYFETEEERERFIRDAYNPPDTPQLQYLRECLRKHKASKRRK